MRIEFTAKTNRKICMINTATFALASGGTVTIDRDCTEWSVEKGILSMTWRDCYLWEINGVNIFDEPFYPNEDIAELMKGAKFLKFDLEDDAGSDYKVTNVTAVIS